MQAAQEAIAEIGCMTDVMGGTAASVHGLPGTGDLYVTCQGGRNSQMGRLLGTGLRYREAKVKHMADETIEGAELALAIGPTLEYLLEQGVLARSSFPLATTIINTICHNQLMQIPWTRFYPEY